MKVRKYRPSFFSGFPDEEYEVNSKEELLNSPLCANIITMPSFDRFTFNAYEEDYGILSSNFTSGEHYVVAIIKNKEDVATLKEWFNNID